MGKRGPGDQSDPQPPYGQPGDGQWHMGNYLSESQDKGQPGTVTGTTSKGIPIIPKSSRNDQPFTDYEKKPISERMPKR